MEVWQPRSYRRNIHPDYKEGQTQAAWAERTRSKVGTGGLGWPHIYVQITGRNDWGASETSQSRVSAQEKEASKPLAVETCGGCDSGRNSQPHRRVHWKDPHLEHTQTHPSRNQHQKGPVCLWVAGKVTESLWRAEQPALFPDPSLSHSATPQWGSCPTLVNT